MMNKAADRKAEKPSRKLMEARARKKATKEAVLAMGEAKKEGEGRPYSKKELLEFERRDGFIRQYMPFAASVANRVCQTLSPAIDHDEVLCNARVGLLEAAKRYDEKQEVDFRTFAYYRIKGAIYDGLRRSGWLPRSLYQKIKFEEAANEYLQHKADGARKDDILLSKTDEEIGDMVNTLASIYVVSLDAAFEDGEEFDEAQSNVDLEKMTEFMEVRKYMREAISSLPYKEKQLVMMYYFQNRTLEEIGVRLSLSKSWVCRLHARALELMLKRIKMLANGAKEEV